MLPHGLRDLTPVPGHIGKSIHFAIVKVVAVAALVAIVKIVAITFANTTVYASLRILFHVIERIVAKTRYIHI